MMATQNLELLTNSKLREICKSLGLAIRGRKAELIVRIETKQGSLSTPKETRRQNAGGDAVSENAHLQKSPMAQELLVDPQLLASSAITPAAISVSPSKKRKSREKEALLKTQDGKAGCKRLKESNAALLHGPIGKASDTNAQNLSASNVSDPWSGQKAHASQDGIIPVRDLGTVSWATGLPSTNPFDKPAGYGFPQSSQFQYQQGLVNDQDSTERWGVKPITVGLLGETPTPGGALQKDPEPISQSNKHPGPGLTNCSFLPEGNNLAEKSIMPYPTGPRAVPPYLAQGVRGTAQTLCGAQKPYIAHFKSKHMENAKITPAVNSQGNISVHDKALSRKECNLSPSPLKETRGTPILHFKTQDAVNAKGLKSHFIPPPKMVPSLGQLKPVVISPSGVESQHATELQPRCEDMDISWKSIAFPPRFILRKKIHCLSRVLALVAFHCSTIIEPAGDFLKCTITLSKFYYYATVLAYGLLCTDYEFPGRRTNLWLKVKRVDLTIADLRKWYWHRVQQRRRKLQEVRQRWWGERVWTEYILANHLQEKFHTEQGLWFQGINMELLSENEVLGQWDVAARFWSARFCASVFSGRIENIDKMLGGGAYAVAGARPVGENGGVTQVSAGSVVSEVWEIVDKGGNIYFIVGGTGEAIGTLHRSARLFRKCERVVRSSPGPREGTVLTASLIPSQLPSQSYQHDNTRRLLDSLGNITWKSLRMDWRNYVLRLLTVAKASAERRSTTLGLGTEPVPLLLSHLYHPSPVQFKYAIHQRITHPRHRAVCERFILAHAEDYGYSGGKANPISGGRKVGLDLDCKWRVESIVCSGETLRCCGRAGKLAHGLAFVQTMECGWYILEDTGEVIAQEDYGIQGVWKTILGVDERGFPVEGNALAQLRRFFCATMGEGEEGEEGEEEEERDLRSPSVV